MSPGTVYAEDSSDFIHFIGLRLAVIRTHRELCAQIRSR